MSDRDEMTDSPELGRLRDAVAGVAVAERPPLDAITARGAIRVRRRRYVVASIASAACLALGTTMALSLNNGAGSPRGPLTVNHHTIRTAAYTIVMNPDGTATLSISPKELFDASTLQSDLEKDGIPAKVTTDNFCTSDPAPDGFSEVVSFDPGGPGPENPATLTIDPSAMANGIELSFGELQMQRGMVLAAATLIDSGSYDCTSNLPTIDDLRQSPPGTRLMFIAIPASWSPSGQ